LKGETKTLEVEQDVSLSSFQDSTCASVGQIASVMFPEQVPIPTRFDAEDRNYSVENFRFTVDMWLASRQSLQDLDDYDKISWIKPGDE
jgi:hypothetical protein